MNKQEISERIMNQLIFDLNIILKQGSPELKKESVRKFLDRKISHLVGIVKQINIIQKNKEDKKDVSKLQDRDSSVFYLMDIMAIIEPLDKLDLTHLKASSISDLYSKFPDIFSSLLSASEFVGTKISDIGTSAGKAFFTSDGSLLQSELSRSFDDTKDWVLTSIPVWFRSALKYVHARLKPDAAESNELFEILNEEILFGKSKEDLLNELRLKGEVDKAKSFLKELDARNDDLMSDIGKVKRVLSKLACGLMVLRDEVTSNKQSMLQTEKLKNNIDEFVDEIVKGDKKYLSPLTRTKIFLKEMNPLTELSTSLGLVDHYKNMTTYAKVTSATVIAFAGLVVSTIAVPVSFVAFTLFALGAAAVVTTATLKIAYQSSVIEIKDTAVKVKDISSKGASAISSAFSSAISRGNFIELSTFSKDKKYYVDDVEGFIYCAFLKKSEVEKRVFKQFIKDTFNKGLTSQKDQKSVGQSLEKLFHNCSEHAQGNNPNIKAVIKDIYEFMKSINDITKESKEKNGIVSNSDLESFIEKPQALFEKLRENVKEARNASHDKEDNQVLNIVSTNEIASQRERGVSKF